MSVLCEVQIQVHCDSCDATLSYDGGPLMRGTLQRTIRDAVVESCNKGWKFSLQGTDTEVTCPGCCAGAQ